MTTKSIYPWNKWLKPRKKKLVLYKGKDYECQTHGLAQMFRRKSPPLGLRVSLSLYDDKLEVLVSERS